MKIFLYIIGFILIINVVLIIAFLTTEYTLYLDNKIDKLKKKRKQQKRKINNEKTT